MNNDNNSKLRKIQDELDELKSDVEYYRKENKLLHEHIESLKKRNESLLKRLGRNPDSTQVRLNELFLSSIS